MRNETTVYFRPQTLTELDEILSKFQGKVNFLAGGDYNFANLDETAPLVDLQNLKFDQIVTKGQMIEIGGLATLQQMGEVFHGWNGMQEALSVEAGLNVRDSLSITNFLKSTNGRSPFLCVLLALMPTLELLPSYKNVTLEDYLIYGVGSNSELISRLTLTLPKTLAYEAVARTPKDRPFICMAATQDEADNLRVSCGGLQSFPKVFRIVGNIQHAYELTRQAYRESSDAWASAEYRMEMSQVLLGRLLHSLGLVG